MEMGMNGKQGDVAVRRMSANNPFMWASHPRPSIFMASKAFTGYATGRTHSQVSSEAADAFEKKHGRSLGTVGGLSEAADKGTEERTFMRKQKR